MKNKLDFHDLRNKLVLIVIFFTLSCEDEGSIPKVTTNEVTNITQTSAQCGGSIINNGGSSIKSCGVCWSTNPNPTISDNNTVDEYSNENYISLLTDINANTTYYVRAYATNKAGTGYGEAVLFPTSFSENEKVIDIDGNEYDLIHMGEQTWMAQNLKVTRHTDGKEIDYVYWYNNDETIYKEKFGGLYLHEFDSKLCPSGWKVPSKEDWSTLIEFLGGVEIAGGKLKAKGTTEWLSPNTDANNSSGFAALPGGYTSPQYEVMNGFGEVGRYWTTHGAMTGVTYVEFSHNSAEAKIKHDHSEYVAYSIRCIKITNPEEAFVRIWKIDNISEDQLKVISVIDTDGGSQVTSSGVCWSNNNIPTIDDNITSDNVSIGSFSSYLIDLDESTTYYIRAYATNSAGTVYSDTYLALTLKGDNSMVSDIDGNEYHLVNIGEQTWLKENLKTTTFNDGTSISNVTENSDWKNLNSAAYSFYDNDGTNQVDYGTLYNWYAVETDKLCPTGWHVPSNEEWAYMEEYICTAKNSYIEIFPETYGGYRDYYGGSFYDINEESFWWTSTEANTGSAISYEFIDGNRYNTNESQYRNGFSVRCVKND